jgi:hypothetical protein
MKRLTGSWKRASSLAVAVAAALLLASCGGGDPYAGIWKGTLEGNRDVNALVLGDGTYYMVYSKPNSTQQGGLIHGTGDFHGARVTSTDGRDYNWERRGSPPVTLEAKVGARQSVTGSVGGSKPFTLTYQREFDYEADLASLTGAFVGKVWFVGGERNAVFTVTPAGAVSTNIDGCLITGQVSPRADGNAYDLRMTFGAFPCAFPNNTTFTGVALFRGEERRLDAAVVNPAVPIFGAQGIAFTGYR